MTKNEILAALSIEPVHVGLFKMYLDAQGNILGPTEYPGWKIPPLLWRTLSDEGNVRSHFDLASGPLLRTLPVWNPGAANDAVPSYLEKKRVAQTVESDPFFTVLPTLTLSVIRLEENLLIGIVRRRNILPNISIGGSGGIVYFDAEDRLAGFSQGFMDLLDVRHAEPGSLLGQPAGRFFDPAPGGMLERQLSLDPPRPESQFRQVLSTRFTEPVESGVRCTRPESVSITPRGLLCRNETDDFIYLTLPAALDSHRDFLFSMECDIIRGLRPSIFLTRMQDPAGYERETPDVDGYQLGVRPDLNRFILKRKSILQKLCEAAGPADLLVMAFSKIGETLRLIENRKKKIEYGDFNFIHHPSMRLAVGIRSGSECLIRSLRLSEAEAARPAEASVLPIVRFRNAAASALLLTRVDNASLAANHPGISAWVFENITHMEDKMARLRNENKRLQLAGGDLNPEFIGNSGAMAQVKTSAARIAATAATVLIQGPTGSGKEVLARFIHDRSGREKMPFIKIDCSVISPTLMESELFGHEKGAFTGANEQHIGRFEQANGGTVFLDEAGSLSPEAQAKLLHFMQDHTVTRVGGRTQIRLDVRIIVASNIPLLELVRQGRFREDLFFRIDVVTLNLPGLSERMDDLAELIARFIEEFNVRHQRRVKGLTPAASRKIASHLWPGNVRELKNTIERAVLFCAGETLEAGDIVFSSAPTGRKAGVRGSYIKIASDTAALRLAVRENHGNLKAAAAALQMPRRSLYNRLKKLGLRPDEVRKG